MSAGDFVAFPTPSVAHNFSNPFDEEVVYMMGGEHLLTLNHIEGAEIARHNNTLTWGLTWPPSTGSP